MEGYRFKFCSLHFEKGKSTNSFYTAFRIDPREAIRPKQLEIFLNNVDEQLEIPISVVKNISPDSFSVG